MHPVLQPLDQLRQQLAQVDRQLGDAARLLEVGGVAGERVRVLLHRHAAARRVHHDRLDRAVPGAALDQRPPGVDVAPHLRARALEVVEVQADRAAAAGLVGDQRLDAGGVEHARRRAVDVGHHRRLHAAHQQRHLAVVAARRPAVRARVGARRHLVLQHLRQERAERLAELERRREHRRGQPFLQRPARRAFGGRPLDALVDDAPADLDQVAVLHARRAGRLAVAAGEAAVEVDLRRARHRLAFEHLLHQVDAPARAVELVAEQLVGRAGRGAEAAVHALAQDRLGLDAFGRVLEFGGEMGLHAGSRGRIGNGVTKRAIPIVAMPRTGA